MGTLLREESLWVVGQCVCSGQSDRLGQQGAQTNKTPTPHQYTPQRSRPPTTARRSPWNRWNRPSVTAKQHQRQPHRLLTPALMPEWRLRANGSSLFLPGRGHCSVFLGVPPLSRGSSRNTTAIWPFLIHSSPPTADTGSYASSRRLRGKGSSGFRAANLHPPPIFSPPPLIFSPEILKLVQGPRRRLEGVGGL